MTHTVVTYTVAKGPPRSVRAALNYSTTWSDLVSARAGRDGSVTLDFVPFDTAGKLYVSASVSMYDSKGVVITGTTHSTGSAYFDGGCPTSGSSLASWSAG